MERKIKVKCVEDFDSCLDGGCKVLCEIWLLCGYVCRWYCYFDDKIYKLY